MKLTKSEIQHAAQWLRFLNHNADSPEEEKEHRLFAKMLDIAQRHEKTVRWIQEYTESIDQPYMAFHKFFLVHL